ncbi:hypothetical protein BSKO_10990 [Bryopsis sp. KO-2023]|nr:hypothetical protein BSKO_10990 [Bryopsis sp. KO-2023]
MDQAKQTHRQRPAWVYLIPITFILLFNSWTVGCSRVVRVGSSLELWEACLERNVTTIHVFQNLSLRPDVWPGDDGAVGLRDFLLTLGRNVTIEKAPELTWRPVVDLDFMRLRLGVAEGDILTLRGLEFVRGARDPEEQLALDFFGLAPGSYIVYDNVIAEVAVDLRRSLGRLETLDGLPRPDVEPFPELQNGTQKMRIFNQPSEECVKLSGRECPSGAIYLEDFANVILVLYKAGNHQWPAVLIHRNSFLSVVDVEKGKPKSSQDISGEKTVVVQSLVDLGLELNDPEVTVINVWKDLAFKMSAWPNREGVVRKKLLLGHNVRIRGHPLTLKKSATVVVDFNFLEGGLHVVNRTTLILEDLFFDRSTRFGRTGRMPFFDVDMGSRVLLDRVVVRTPGYMDGERGKKHLQSIARSSISLGPKELVPSLEVVEGEVCGGDLADGPCDVVISVDDLYLEPKKAFSQQGAVAGRKAGPRADTGFIMAMQSFLMCFGENKYTVESEEEIVFREAGVVSVHSETELKRAMGNESVTGVHLTANLDMSEKRWSDKSQVVLDRDFSITTHPQAPVAMKVDFDYMSDRVRLGVGSMLHLEWMNFTRVSRNGENLHYVPFFTWQDNTTIIFVDLLAQMAIEPKRTGLLDYGYLRSFRALPGPPWLSDPFANFTTVELLRNSRCQQLAGVTCKDGALYIKQGVQEISLKDLPPRNASRTGNGVFLARNMLLVADNLDRKKLLTRRETRLAQRSTAQNEVTKTANDRLDSNRNHGVLTASVMIAVYILVGTVALVAMGSAFAWYCYKRYKLQLYALSRPGGIRQEERVIKEHQEVAAELLGDVTLGALMGVGGFARVYRATWNGANVAVKVILHRGGDVEASIEWEAVLSTMLRHPHLVQGYHYVTRTVHSAGADSSGATEQDGQDDSALKTKLADKSDEDRHSFVLESYSKNQRKFLEGNTSTSSDTSLTASVLLSDSSMMSLRSRYQTPGLYRETWLVQEFCDKGSLLESLQAGLFNILSMDFCMSHIYRTAQDIARGMKYLHDNKVIHGDLKSSNVLLQRSATDPRGYVAKVADFGLSRQMISDRSHLSTSSFGTVTHMPPEVLMQGHLSLKADVYSFGMILWEMVAGELPFRNMMQMEVMRKVVLEKKRPEIPSWVPDEHKALIEQCWCHEPQNRLTFRALLDTLDTMLAHSLVNKEST